MQTINSKIFTVPRFMAHFILKQRYSFIMQFILCLGWSAKESLFPFIIKNMINIIHTNESKAFILKSLVISGLSMLILWTIMESAMRLQGLLALKSFPQFKQNIRSFLFNCMNGHSYDYYNNCSTGNIAAKISELPKACETLLEILLLHLTSIGGAVFIGIILLWLANSHFAWLFLAWLTIHLSISFYFSKVCHQAAECQSNANAILNGKIVDAFTNILNILLFARGKYEINYLSIFQQDELRAAKHARWTIEKAKIFQSVFAILYIITMMYLLISGWFFSTISVGDFALVPMLSFSLLGMIWWLSNQIQIIIREIGCIQSGLQLIKIQYQIQDKLDSKQIDVRYGEILFKNVTFQYPKQQKLFKDLSLHISAKQKVGIVGLSGAGKSTFIKLLLRLYDLNKGAIFIDNQDISEITQESLRDHIAVIPQDLNLFHRTLYENIQYGRLDATENEVYEAALLAGCDGFIQNLPQGYHTLVGENGVKLSGGQRQRIAIARAILKNAPILIFDEATSSLDIMTEYFIQKNLHSFMNSKTVIIIAHRISTLNKVDRILVFEQGKIVGDGNKENLMDTNLYFKQLYAMQFAENIQIVEEI